MSCPVKPLTTVAPDMLSPTSGWATCVLDHSKHLARIPAILRSCYSEHWAIFIPAYAVFGITLFMLIASGDRAGWTSFGPRLPWEQLCSCLWSHPERSKEGIASQVRRQHNCAASQYGTAFAVYW